MSYPLQLLGTQPDRLLGPAAGPPASVPLGAPPSGVTSSGVASSGTTSSGANPGTQTGSSFSFHELLSELNPLQYIPIIGAIYRSVTGDTIPESARVIGSLVFSGLTGGPIGLATSIGVLGLEKAFGIDPEPMMQHVLASLGIGHDAVTPAATVPGDTQEAGAAGLPAPSDPQAGTAAGSIGVAMGKPPEPWSVAQLAAYGITTSADNSLTRGAVAGSDVLNDLVLASFSGAARQQGVPSSVMTT